MSIEIKVPQLGESISVATLAKWLKQPGEAVTIDETIAELETDKVSLEITAPAAGIVGKHLVQEGEEVQVGALLTILNSEDGTNSSQPKEVSQPKVVKESEKPVLTETKQHSPMPAAQKLMDQNSLSATQIGQGSGLDGRITREDVLSFLAKVDEKAVQPVLAPKHVQSRVDDPREERVKMTRLRKTIARRLKEAQNTAAMLTTFNEVDMSAVMKLRNVYKDAFAKKHTGARLGFMSFFVKAAVSGLLEFPAINAQIDGEDVIYRNFVNMGIAVGGPNGLVVPVLRNADAMNFADIEGKIIDFAQRAKNNSLRLDDLSEGTFSITNGGIYGSLMSTPILNAPQSGILGMHAIKERPIVDNGQVVIRPMMYLALSYDHRIVDGKEAVSFLVHIKDRLEHPERLLLDV